MLKRLMVGLVSMLLAVLAMAQTSTPILLAPQGGEVSLSGRMQWLEDVSTRMTLAQAHTAAGWRPLAVLPDFGYTRSAIWLRLTVEQPPQAVSDWRLEIDNAQLDDARLYRLGPNGSWQEQRIGRFVPREDWPLNSRTPTFGLQLPPGSHTLYLRLQGEHTLSSGIHLWTAEAYRVHSTYEALIFGGYFGMYAIVIVLQIFFWTMTRESRGGWYLFYTLVLLAGTLLNSGYPQNMLDLTSGTSTLFGVYLCLAPTAIARLTAVWLELDQHLPRLNRIYQYGSYGVAVFASALVLTDSYLVGVQLSQVSTLVLVLVSFGLGLCLWRRKVPHAGFYLLVFGFIDLGILARFLRNLGLLPVSFITDYALFIGITLHLLAMSLYFIYRYNHLHSSLKVEQRAREEQQDFVNMVSHEFRTPLAIINTSIQQLVANLGAPIEKTLQRGQNIRNATQRLAHLLDDYLSMDRLDSAHQPVKLISCDFFEVIEDATSDWPLGRIKIHVKDLPSPFLCDPDLMRIVLRNLLANADRHSPADLAIELNVSGYPHGGLHIRLQDHGEGIAPDELSHLFQKYFRGRGSKGKPGAGLGLYLVQRIVHAHGGTIEVQSTLGQGTTFSILLRPGPLRRA